VVPQRRRGQEQSDLGHRGELSLPEELRVRCEASADAGPGVELQGEIEYLG